MRAAQEDGFDPALALAIAERESDFNPTARASKTIFGAFQMNRGERMRYGAGDSTDPYVQAKAWIAYAKDLQSEMAQHLGRAPTSAELYHGHYWGGARAARIASGKISSDTPVSEIFTPRELAENPNIVRAGTAGSLASSVTGDINRRIERYGGMPDATASTGGTPRYSDFGDIAPSADYSGWGELADAGAAATNPGAAQGIADLPADPVGFTTRPADSIAEEMARRRAAAGDENPIDANVGKGDRLDTGRKGDREYAFGNRWGTVPASKNVIDRSNDPPFDPDAISTRPGNPFQPPPPGDPSLYAPPIDKTKIPRRLARDAGAYDIGASLSPWPQQVPQ
jgi:hypothetical protein